MKIHIFRLSNKDFLESKNNIEELYFFDRMKSGDESAFDFFFNFYYPGLCIYAKKLLPDNHLIEDIVQNVFLNFWKDRNTTRINESVRAYLFRSVHNKCMDVIKHKEVVAKHTSTINFEDTQSSNIIWETFIEAELYSILLEAIEKLPPECQKVFKYSRIKLYTNKEIADKLKLSVKTVENQISKALKILRKELKDYLPLLLLII